MAGSLLAVHVIHYPGSFVPPQRGYVVSIGAYDGVHAGHRWVIDELRRRAASAGKPSAVITFDRHPATVVRPQSAPKLLTDLDQKLELLASTGLDATVVVRFDEQRAAEEAEDFVKEVIVNCLGATVVVVGRDFHFGRNRRGTVELLRSLGSEHGFTVVGLDLVDEQGNEADGPKVSSTTIRQLLAEGDIGRASSLLGRPHEVRGVVEKGDQRGRELGFPTANVAVPAEICMPCDGIYAGWYERPDGTVSPAAISLGRRPTFYVAQERSLLEAHVLDFSGDLYGEPAKVRFVARLRGEERFETVDALVEQMQRDVANTRMALGLPPC